MRYLLDTNICIYIIKKKPIEVIKRFTKVRTGDIAVSNISVAELYYGVCKSSKPNENMIALQEFLSPLEVLDFNKEAAIAYGNLRAGLEAKGTPIGAMDLLIAAQAVSENLTLITNNEKEFRRVVSIKVENWAK